MTLPVSGSDSVMHQFFPVKNLRRPPDLGGSPTFSGVPTSTQVPMRSLANSPFLGGSSPAPTGSTTTDTKRRTAATPRARYFIDLSIVEAPVSWVTKERRLLRRTTKLSCAGARVVPATPEAALRVS